MINKVVIENFKSHKHSVLEFSSGLNVIIGLSGSGKSTVLKAIKWCTDNVPHGDGVRSHNGGNPSVTLISNDYEIIRKKEKKDFYYINGKELTAFGTSVPEPVSQALNLSDINFHNQFEGHFLLSKNSTEVSKYLNKIANLESIDLANKNINSWILSLEKESKASEANLEEYESQISEFSYLEKFEADVEVLERMYFDYEKRKKDLNELIRLNNSLFLIDQELRGKKELSRLKSRVDKIMELIEKREVLKKELNSLNTLINSLINTNENLTERENELKKLEKEFEKNFPEICPLCGSPNPKKKKDL